MSLNLNLRPEGGSDIVLRQMVALGHQPLILIEFDGDADTGKAEINIDATGFDQEELANCFVELAGFIRGGTVVEDSDDGTEDHNG